jgi:hypothetical protein
MTTSRQIAEARCFDWVREANAASRPEDKVAMYELAALAAIKYDAELAENLRLLAYRHRAVK